MPLMCLRGVYLTCDAGEILAQSKETNRGHAHPCAVLKPRSHLVIPGLRPLHVRGIVIEQRRRLDRCYGLGQKCRPASPEDAISYGQTGPVCTCRISQLPGLQHLEDPIGQYHTLSQVNQDLPNTPATPGCARGAL